MPPKDHHDPLENILHRTEDLDKASLTNLVNRLARERRLLASVFGLLREGIVVVDQAGTIEYANSSAAGMLGFDLADIGSAVLWKFVPDLRRTLNFDESGALVEDSHLTRELALSYPERRLVRLYLAPFDELPDDAERPALFVITLADITQDRTQTRQELENERVRSILHLAAGVAHELGNPLNSLTIHLQLMERGMKKLGSSAGKDRIRRSLEVCSGEVERLDSIITHFLQAIRPSPPDLADTDLVPVLENALEFLGPELSSAGVRVDVELNSRLPIVLADRNQVKQVFFNVLKNARQAMREGGVIKVRAFSDDTFVYVQIGDTGEGISEEDLKKVFEPYFTTKSSGSGLGMMICERIMRDHGGQIAIDSRKGVGTIVTLQFPQKNRRIHLLENSPEAGEIKRPD